MYQSDYSHLLVYEDGGIHGTVLLSLCEAAMYQAQRFAVVENIVVSIEMRGKGIGACLLKHVDSICAKADCSMIMLSSSAAKTDAHRFFILQGYAGDKKKGFVKYQKAFSETNDD